jgi:RNA polymerase sigma-70 factor (ECF subfamily)
MWTTLGLTTGSARSRTGVKGIEVLETQTDSGPVPKAEDEQDALLLRQIERKEMTAFESLYKRYHAKLSRFVVGTLGRTDLVDEIINDVMYVVWKKAASYDHQCKPSTWIFGIAYNKARKHFRSAGQPHIESLSNFDADAEMTGSHHHWLERLERDDLCTSILASLSSEHRAVIELTYFYGLHYREIGQIMGCPENTVKTRMFHARRCLSRLAQSELGT